MKVIKYLGTIVLSVFIIALIAPYFISLNTYKKEIETQVQNLTGRSFSVNGDVDFRILPRPYLKINDIELGSIDGAKEKNLAQLDSVEVQLSIMPLLGGTVSVDQVTINSPRVNLETLPSGKKNWELDQNLPGENAGAPSQNDQNVTEKSSKDSSFQVHIERIKVKDAVVSILDSQSKSKYTDINLDVQFDSLTGPFNLQAELMVYDKPIVLKGTIDGIKGEVPFSVAVDAFGKKIAASGAVNMDAMTYEGEAKIEGRLTDLKALIPALKVPDSLKKTYTLTTQLKGSLSEVDLRNIKFVLGPLVANGAASIDIQKMTGALKTKLMPGDINFEIKPTSTNPNNITGFVSLTSQDTKAFLEALSIPTDVIPAYLLRAFSLKTNILFKDNALTLKTIDLDAGKAKLNGQLTVKEMGQETQEAQFDLRTPDVLSVAALFGYESIGVKGPVKLKGIVSGALDDANVSANIYAANAKTSIRGTVKKSDKTIRPNLRLKSQGKNLSKTLGGIGVKEAPKDLKEFDLDAFLTGDFPQRLKVKLDKSQFGLNRDIISAQGEMDLFLGRVKPKVSVKLTLSELNLDRLLAQLNKKSIRAVSTKVPTPKKPKSRWSHTKIDLGFLKSFDGDVTLKIPEIKKGALVFDTIQSDMRVANGVMDITKVSGNLYGGELTMKARVSSQTGQPITLTAHLKNAKLKNIAPAGTSIKVLKGDFSLDADLTTGGHSEYQFVSNLSGALNFKGTEGQVSGFSLDGVMKNLNNVRDVGGILRILDSAFSGGTTDFKSINMISTISKGVIKLTKFDLDAIKARVNATGSVSLPKYSMAIEAVVSLDVKDLPAFKVLLSGPLDQPRHRIRADALTAYMIQNVLTGVIGNIKKGDGSPQSILRGVLGIGRQNQGGSSGTQSSQNQDGSQSQQAPSKQSRQQNTQPIEKAVEGLIKNLF